MLGRDQSWFNYVEVVVVVYDLCNRMGCLHCLPRLPIKTRNYPGPGECNAMNYPYYCFDVITGDFALYRHSLLVAVAETITGLFLSVCLFVVVACWLTK